MCEGFGENGPSRNPELLGLSCIQCSQWWQLGDYMQGCSLCWQTGTPSNLRCVYLRESSRLQLPYTSPVTLGEGRSPLVSVPNHEGLFALLEGSNPTGSHKDRYSAQAISHALVSGYDRILAASSGNAGLSIAAYAARADLRCEVVITADVPLALQRAIEDTGATIHLARDGPARWAYIREAVARDPQGTLSLTNTAVPVVGSSAFGIEGYKTVALNILEALGRTPDHVIVPTSRGDLVWGTWLGFVELSHFAGTGLPRMHCVEPFPRVSAVLRHQRPQSDFFSGDAGSLVSIGGDSVTFQTVAAVEQSKGSAAVVRPVDAEYSCGWLRRHGFLVEASSAAALAAYVQLSARRLIAPGALSVLVLTSHMFKGI